MRWIHLIIVGITLHSALSEEEDEETNDVSALPGKINLDSNLRRALLKALTELENEEANRAEYSIDDGSKEKTVEKASASSVSIFSNGNSVTAVPISTSTITSTTPKTVTVIFQKSEGQEQHSVPIIQKEAEFSESILTSATSNFANEPFGKVSQEEKVEKISSQNSIFNDDKTVTKLQKVIVTTSAPAFSTEENEAKVEDVQFFSAPLVAAFTVHQDEAGLPKKVEPIFRTQVPSKFQEDIIIEKEQEIKFAKQQEQAKLVQQQTEKIKLEELKRQQEKLQLQEKQKSLEEEIYRLNLSLRQQQQIFLKQQEELRSKNNAQPFVPISNPSFTTERPVLFQQLPFNNNQQQVFKPQSVSVTPSVSFNPLLDAGKLPPNAQFLPIKAPVDFRAPFAFNNNNFNRQTNPNNFNQNNVNFNPNNNFNQATNFNNQQNNNFNNQQNQSNRIFRQNTGVGNFGVNNDFNNFNRNTNSFSIQPAINVDNYQTQGQNNRFFRSNLEAPQTSFLQPPLQPPQNTRFFRSNLEGSHTNNQANNYQLSNLLYNSGAFRGKSNEDLSLISKVLSLNHVGGNGLSLRPELRQQFARNF